MKILKILRNHLERLRNLSSKEKEIFETVQYWKKPIVSYIPILTVRWLLTNIRSLLLLKKLTIWNSNLIGYLPYKYLALKPEYSLIFPCVKTWEQGQITIFHLYCEKKIQLCEIKRPRNIWFFVTKIVLTYCEKKMF